MGEHIVETEVGFHFSCLGAVRDIRANINTLSFKEICPGRVAEL
jgi:hypothetical protein